MYKKVKSERETREKRKRGVVRKSGCGISTVADTHTQRISYHSPFSFLFLGPLYTMSLQRIRPLSQLASFYLRSQCRSTHSKAYVTTPIYYVNAGTCLLCLFTTPCT